LQADDDVPTLQQLLERNRVLQHDFEQAEHHRQADDHSGTADDDRDPYDAAEHDLIEYIRKHRAVLNDDFYLNVGGRFITYYCDKSYLCVGDRFVTLDEPTTGDRGS
jgi:hypothetical protein